MKMIMSVVTGLLIISIAHAQFSLEIENQNGYSSNSFANYKIQPDSYSIWSLQARKDWIQQESGFRLYYQGNAGLYKSYNDRNYHRQGLGVAYYRYLDTNQTNMLYAEWSASKRFHSEVYKWYETTDFDGYVNLKWAVLPQLYLYTGLSLNGSQFKNLKAFSNWQNTLFLRLSRFFNTGTTVMAEIDIISKSYNPESSVETTELFPDVVTLGKGTSQQIATMLKVAQSLGQSTGLSSQAMIRRNTSNSVRYLGASNGYYYTDEELFDDVFGYESEEFTMQLKSRIFWGITATLGSNIRFKHYQNRLALDLEGMAFEDERLRDDTRTYSWIELKRPLGLGTIPPLQISLRYGILDNDSNDPYYDYGSHYFSVSLGQEF